MAAPRRDTRGIVDAAGLFARVRFRRREPAPALRPYLEHYWLIDWDLDEPYVSHVVPHPSVNVVFQHLDEASRPFAEIAGIRDELFAQRLAGRGRVCGVQFRPGGFRPFSPRHPVSHWTGRRVPLAEAMPVGDEDVTAILGPDGEDERVAALDAFLQGVLRAPGGGTDGPVARATALADLVRQDRTMQRVDLLAAAAGLSPRSLQRLFGAYVGVGPKWVVLRYRIHEALERAEAEGAPGAVDWPALAAELGYSDQAHLVRDFTATVGVPPTAYARQG
ncbi:helix-turn-helix domain-containing protein [Streptomyces fuscigenes]|uniref:helix-turn-helix domain-containing protein n=1 Tax=Streptomyces fuscigenes TaxID=1528880 RepID=UPI001F3A74BB|nr:helix-turn-helix domain-containing protein [Streptomyces fuscigenes]MCF3961058.1 helix-turn-helix domain-containing protein [Streptomyces fuscigenes]